MIEQTNNKHEADKKAVDNAEPIEQPLSYTDNEVSGIMQTLGQIYALDDCIYNQEQLRRPETFIKPLRDIRERIAHALVENTSKGKQQPGTD